MATNPDSTSGIFRNGIEPLKGAENYISWSVQIQDVLVELGLLDYVNGTLPQPTAAAELAAWKLKDRKALTAIRLRISSIMMSHVLSSTTSKEAWDALQNVFNTQGPLARILARRKLLRFSIEEGAPLEEEIRRLPFGNKLADWKKDESEYLRKVISANKADELVNPYEPRVQQGMCRRCSIIHKSYSSL